MDKGDVLVESVRYKSHENIQYSEVKVSHEYAMEGAVNAREGSRSKQGEERLSDNESDEEDPEPPSPIQVGSERALTPDVDFPDPQELRKMDAETQNRLKAFLEVAGVKLSHVDARTFQDPEILRKLTNR